VHVQTFDALDPFTGTSGYEPLAATGGALVLETGTQNYAKPGPAGAYTLTAGIGADTASPGSYNVGLTIGQNHIVFHPGYTPIPGALRVEGPGGFGNASMGFVPAVGVLHEFEVTADGTGGFTIQVTDGANPANVFTTSFTNAGSVGGAVGFRRSGPNVGTGLYDNLAIAPAGGRPSLSAFDPPFTTMLNGGGADIVNGMLQLSGSPTGGDSDQLWTVPGFSGDLLISAEVGASTNSPGSFNVGLQIGQNSVVFHPGLSGGALRVEGPGGFGNTNVGFTPATDVLHLLEVAARHDGLFELSLTNRDDPTQVFTASFFNPASAGGDISLRRSGPAVGTGLYDNLVVQLVPEPATLSLLGLGGLSLLARRRRR
jgi:hypothetical protein